MKTLCITLALTLCGLLVLECDKISRRAEVREALAVEQLGVRIVRQQSPANKIAELSQFIAIENWFAGRGFAYPPAAVKIFRANLINKKEIILLWNTRKKKKN